MHLFGNVSFLPTLLCPAGHLPHTGGDWQFLCCHPLRNVGDWREATRRLISPRVGEMAGRPEGGAKDYKRRLPKQTIRP